MSKDCEEQILKHQISCQKDTIKDRHEFRGEMHKIVGGLDSKIDNTNKKVSELDKTIGLFNQNSKNMQESIDRIETKLDKFIDAADKTYAKKDTVSIHSKILWVVGVSVVSGMAAFIWGLIIDIIGK